MADTDSIAHAPCVAVAARPPERIEILRVRGGIGAATDAVEAAIGMPLPREPGTATGDRPRVAWLAPGEWMVVAAPGAGLAGAAAIAYPAHVADVSDGRVGFDVTGPAARDLLAKGTSLDLHPRVFPAGHCARTLFAQVAVLIDRPDDTSGFRLYADASHAAHLRRWFADAAIEFHAN